MGLHFLVGQKDGGNGREACALYDSTSGWAFGPIFDSADDAESFLAFAKDEHGVSDIRRISESALDTLYKHWIAERQAAHKGDHRKTSRLR